MLNYYPPSGGQGISLGLVRQYRCAYGAPSSGVGTPPPRSIALVLQKPSFVLELLAVRPFASSLYRFQVCYLAAGLTYPPLRSGSCLGFWSLLARCSSPHPRSVFHFRFLVHSWLVRLRGPASVQLSLARYPAHRMASILCMRLSLVRRMGQPRETRLRVVCISHCTCDFLPPCMQKPNAIMPLDFIYVTAFPVLPICFSFPSFSSCERYRVAVALVFVCRCIVPLCFPVKNESRCSCPFSGDAKMCSRVGGRNGRVASQATLPSMLIKTKSRTSRLQRYGSRNISSVR